MVVHVLQADTVARMGKNRLGKISRRQLSRQRSLERQWSIGLEWAGDGQANVSERAMRGVTTGLLPTMPLPRR